MDEQRRFFDGIDSLLTEVAREIALNVPEGLAGDLNVVYFSQIGFLISMEMDQETGRSFWEGTETDIWVKMFSSETSVYYKNGQMYQMDAEIGDVWNEICGRSKGTPVVVPRELMPRKTRRSRSYTPSPSEYCSTSRSWP